MGGGGEVVGGGGGGGGALLLGGPGMVEGRGRMVEITFIDRISFRLGGGVGGIWKEWEWLEGGGSVEGIEKGTGVGGGPQLWVSMGKYSKEGMAGGGGSVGGGDGR